MNYQRLKQKIRGFFKKGCVSSAVACMAGVLLLQVHAQELCNEGLGFINGSFSDVDGAGEPIEWKAPHEKTGVMAVVDNTTYHSAPGAIKIYPGETGFTGKGTPAASQGLDKSFLNSVPAGTELYFKAWVKTDNTPAMGGTQIVAHSGASLPGPPWFKTVKWEGIASPSGTSDWKEITGTFHTWSGATSINIHLYLASISPCTLWVDDIMISTDNTFDACIPTSARYDLAQTNVTSPSAITLHGSTLTFAKSTDYTVQIVTPDGKQVALKSGYGKKLNLNKSSLAPGCYIVNIKSGIGSLTRPLIIASGK